MDTWTPDFAYDIPFQQIETWNIVRWWATSPTFQQIEAWKYPNIGGWWVTAPTYQTRIPFRVIYSRVVEIRQLPERFNSFMIDKLLDLMSCVRDITPLDLPFHDIEVVNDVTTYRQMTTNVPQTGTSSAPKSKHF